AETVVEDGLYLIDHARGSWPPRGARRRVTEKHAGAATAVGPASSQIAVRAAEQREYDSALFSCQWLTCPIRWLNEQARLDRRRRAPAHGSRRPPRSRRRPADHALCRRPHRDEGLRH